MSISVPEKKTTNKKTSNEVRGKFFPVEKKENFIQYFKKNYALYLFLVPAIILTIVFKYIPMYGAIIAFKDFSPMKGIMGSDWVGLTHFKDFLTSPNFKDIFMNTLKLSFYGLILGFPVPIILALSLNQVRRAAIKKIESSFCGSFFSSLFYKVKPLSLYPLSNWFCSSNC